MPVRASLLSTVVFLLGIGLVSTPAHSPGFVGGSAVDPREFATLVGTLSEAEGYFDTDNFISNEAGYLKILPLFGRLGIHGGVYLGVGPDQNYSYIAEIRPQLAIIVDIRRENLLLHLYLKALFTLSSNRVEFLQRLFARHAGVASYEDADPGIARLMNRLEAAPRDDRLALRNMREVEGVIRSWLLDLGSEDFRTIEYIARAFTEGGPDLRFRSFNRPPSPWYPTYGELILETDSRGRCVNYLASADRYRVVRTLQVENRIIPVVADLGGSQAMGRIAHLLHERRLEVSCFYVSNVEFYLFDCDRWSTYVRNMRSLPWESNAVLIRTFSEGWRPHPARMSGYYMTTILQRAAAFFANESTGRDITYWDLITHDYIAP